jgi:D-ribose pyranose/furanose isomerase RbsD
MKDLLVEFTDNGAILHKDPAVIEEKKGLPYCFINPDLSNVIKVSPSYWVYNSDGEIVPASPEERKRRDELQSVKPNENTVSLKKTLSKLTEDLTDHCNKNTNKVELTIKEEVENIKSVIDQIANTVEVNKLLFKKGVEENQKYIQALNLLNLTKFEKQEKTIKYLTIGLILSTLLTIVLGVI